jgi:broad specificity polyphosphatase/5'/3'-nucleotidase SurE
VVVGERSLILVTCADGIESPGLRVAVQAVLPLGDVTLTAPCEPQSGSGRSLPSSNDGAIHQTLYQVVVHSAQPRSDLTTGI